MEDGRREGEWEAERREGGRDRGEIVNVCEGQGKME